MYSKHWQTFSVKKPDSKIVKYFQLSGHTVCITTAQFCHCRAKAAIDNITMKYFPTNFIKKKTGSGADLTHRLNSSGPWYILLQLWLQILDKKPPNFIPGSASMAQMYLSNNPLPVFSVYCLILHLLFIHVQLCFLSL